MQKFECCGRSPIEPFNPGFPQAAPLQARCEDAEVSTRHDPMLRALAEADSARAATSEQSSAALEARSSDAPKELALPPPEFCDRSGCGGGEALVERSDAVKSSFG